MYISPLLLLYMHLEFDLSLLLILINILFLDAYFTEQNSYSYTYTSTVESSFVGTTPSKSGFQYTCSVIIRVYTGFKSELKVVVFRFLCLYAVKKTHFKLHLNIEKVNIFVAFILVEVTMN